MNCNEPIQHTAEPAELPDALKQALREAYPDPKGRIAAQVMEQIRAEREETERKRRVRQNERRRRRHGLVMKYGGMAACMVILSGALVIASPLMGRNGDSVMADMEYAVEDAADGSAVLGAAETIPETAVPQMALYSADLQAEEPEIAAYSEEAEEEAEETARLTASSSTSRAAEVENAPASGNAMVKLFSARPTTEPAADAALADTAVGEEMSNAVYLQSLFDAGVLTEEVYAAWMQEMGYTDAEDWTKEELCTAFGIE